MFWSTNAGTYLERKQFNEDGIEKTFAVNHLAPFLLTHELLPLLMQAERGRVIAISSYSHLYNPLMPQSDYQSQTLYQFDGL